MRKMRFSERWLKTKDQRIGQPLLSLFQVELANNAEKDGTITLILTLGKKNGLLMKTELSYRCIINTATNGVR